jgi:hypothetical protein
VKIALSDKVGPEPRRPDQVDLIKKHMLLVSEATRFVFERNKKLSKELRYIFNHTTDLEIKVHILEFGIREGHFEHKKNTVVKKQDKGKKLKTRSKKTIPSLKQPG